MLVLGTVVVTGIGLFGTAMMNQPVVSKPMPADGDPPLISHSLSVASPDAPRWLRYAQPFAAKPEQPLISVILLDRGGPRQQIEDLMERSTALSLAVGYDFGEARKRAWAAHRAGHEVLTAAPFGYEDAFADWPNVLAPHLPLEELDRRVRWHLAAIPNSVGLIDSETGDLAEDAEALSNIMERIAEDGALYVGGQPNGRLAVALARHAGAPASRANVRLSGAMGQERLVQALKDAELDARKWGEAIIVVDAEPLILEALDGWLDKRDWGVALAPVSAVVGRMRSAGSS